MAIDGTIEDVPDTPANDERFGRSSKATARVRFHRFAR